MLSTLDLLASSILFCVPRWPRIQFAAKKSYFGTCMVVIIFMYYPFLLWLQCRIISFQQSPKGPFFLLPSPRFYEFMMWQFGGRCNQFNIILWPIYEKRLAKLWNCYTTYTFLNIAIFIIIAVDPKWRATSSAQLKTFSNLVKEEKTDSKTR